MQEAKVILFAIVGAFQFVLVVQASSVLFACLYAAAGLGLIVLSILHLRLLLKECRTKTISEWLASNPSATSSRPR
jgi:predicted Co/Zn/Cd cation transporter (cation efflux family)